MRVTSSAASSVSGGSSPGRRRASIVLPVPGGPAKSRLWPPAAATSSARRARSCPRTSARSGPDGGGRPFRAGTGSGSCSPRRYATASAKCHTGTGSTPARAASGAERAAQMILGMFARRAPSATAKTPGTGRTRPSSASSPCTAWRSSSSSGTCPEAARIASAIARSNDEPSLRSAAGARLTVMRARGHSHSAQRTPLRTRSFASVTARSASPTMVKPGIWPPTWASTSTRRASSPTSACVIARASTLPP